MGNIVSGLAFESPGFDLLKYHQYRHCRKRHLVNIRGFLFPAGEAAAYLSNQRASTTGTPGLVRGALQGP